MRKIDSMTDHELLMELARDKRRQGFWRGVRVVVVLLIIAAILTLGYLYLPKIVAPIQELSQTVSELQEGLDRFNSAMDQFDAMTTDAQQQLDGLSDQAQDLFDQIDGLGLDKLQESASKLEETMDRLSSFFRVGG